MGRTRRNNRRLRPLSRQARRRFLDYIEGQDPDECWTWDGPMMRSDYPLFYGDGRQRSAVGVLYYLYYHKPLQLHEVIQHTCDNRSCMNPNHIYRVDRSLAGHEIQMEKVRHGVNVGEGHPQHRLTAEQVREIRRRAADPAVLQKDLAQEYGVTSTMISKIVHRKAWTHI